MLLLVASGCGDDEPTSAGTGTSGTSADEASTTGASTVDGGTTGVATTGVDGSGTAVGDSSAGDSGTSDTGPDLPPIVGDGILLTRMASWPGGGVEMTVALEDPDGFALGDDRTDALGLRWFDDQQDVPIAVNRAAPDASSGHLLIMIAPEPTAPEHQEILAGVAELIASRPAGERIAIYRWGQTIEQMVSFTRDREVLARVLDRVPMGTAQGGPISPTDALIEANDRLGRVANDQERGLRWALLVGRDLPGETFDVSTQPLRSIIAQWVFRGLQPMDLELMGQGRAVDWEAAGGLGQGLAEAGMRVEAFRDAHYDIGLCGVPLAGRAAELTLQGQDDARLVAITGGAPEDQSPGLIAACDPQVVVDGLRPYPEVIDFSFTPDQWNVYQQRLSVGSKDDFELSVGLWDDAPLGPAMAHLRGQSSFWCNRRNYTLDLATDTARHLMPDSATDEFYLLSMCLDDRYVRAYTAFQLYQQHGVFPIQFRFVELRLQGQTRGVYLLMEKLKEALIDDNARVRSIIRRGFSGGNTLADVKYSATTLLEAQNAYFQVLSQLGIPTGDALSMALDDRLDTRHYLTLLGINTLLQNGDYVDEQWWISTDHVRPDGSIGDWYAFTGWDPDDIFSGCHYGGGYAYPDPYLLAYCAEAEIDEIILQDPVTYARFVDVVEGLAGEITQPVFGNAADTTVADLVYYLQKPGVAAAMTELVASNPAATDPMVAQAEVVQAANWLKTSFGARRQLILDRVANYHLLNP